MLPTVLRALPWLAALGLATACDPGSKPASDSAPAAGTTTKTETVTKSETVKTTEAASRSEATSRSETTTKTETTSVPGKTETTETVAKTESSTTSGETKTTETVAKTESVTKIETGSSSLVAKPVAARIALFFREAPKHQLKVWALPEATASDPTAARDLGIVADDAGGSMLEGTGTPVLSGDGQWLAYLDQGRLELARVDGTAKHHITKHKSNRVLVWITGFSPDSSRLLFYQGEVQTEEGAALPKDVVQGFHELTLADLKLEPKTSLESFIDYTADGRHVILERTLHPTSTAVLTRFDLDTGAMEELQRSEGPFAFLQLVLHGERIAYVRHMKEGGQVVADELRGGKLVELSPEGAFAQYQWPQISRDGRSVVYSDEKTLMIRGFGNEAARALTTCAVACDFAWDSGTTLLLRDGEQLSRVTAEGTVTALATEVKGFAVAGAPG